MYHPVAINDRTQLCSCKAWNVLDTWRSESKTPLSLLMVFNKINYCTVPHLQTSIWKSKVHQHSLKIKFGRSTGLFGFSIMTSIHHCSHFQLGFHLSASGVSLLLRKSISTSCEIYFPAGSARFLTIHPHWYLIGFFVTSLNYLGKSEMILGSTFTTLSCPR